MKKKAKKGRKKAALVHDNDFDVENIVKDELYALSAIFGPEFEEEEEDPLGCSILVVPHEARLENNNVSVKLHLRFPLQYPSEPLELRMQNVQGLDVLTARKVAKQLHEAANEYAKVGEICGFQIIQLCQDLLQELNEVRSESGPGAQLSLWEEMQRREQNEGSISTSERITFNFSGLFDESIHEAGMPPKKSGSEGTDEPSGQGGIAHQEEGPRIVSMSGKGAGRHAKTITASDYTSNDSFSRSLSSLVHSMSSMKLSLPEIVRQMMDRSTSAGAPGSPCLSKEQSSTSDRCTFDEDACTDYTRIQRDFLIGRLLYDFRNDCEFSSCLEKMVDTKMVPFWLGNLLTRHPEMFKRAFKKVMKMPFESSEYEAFSDGLVNFERRSDRVQATETADANTNQIYTSRYKSDFQQIKVLGKGGYGVVYLTLHKFDGRQYAVKQVFLSPDSGGEFDRIMREVQTLSRMQHNHIVRYYAAWLEQRIAMGESDDEDESFSGESWSESFTDSGFENNESASSEGSDESSETDRGLMKRYLYIQMEFCPSTLKKMMDQLNEFDRWKMVRQLLSCLSYVHSKGIIHRDLKPANIFVDSLGDLKLGDFGLAKFLSKNPDAKGRSGEGPLDLNPPRLSQTDGTTGVCGTSFYIAPEVELESRSYTEKVDIFSVGIIVVELWTRFSTEMERIVTLRDLRESGKLPQQFVEEHPNAAALASWLLQNDPAKRPTAHEALKSNLIPTTIGNEQLSDLLRSLPDNPQARERMVTALFQLQISSGQTQQEAGSSDLSTEFLDLDISLDLENRNKVLETMIRVFKQFGAIQMRSMDVCRYDPTSSSLSSMTAMTPSGNFISLRYNLRSNFVNWVISKSILDDDEASNSLRRFEISTVYRRVKGYDIPKPLMQADFDILFPATESGGKYAPIAEAETIAAVANVLNSLDNLHDCWELRLSHVSIFPEIIARLEVAKDIQEPIYQILRLAAMSTSSSSALSRSSRMRDLQPQLEALGLHKDVVARIKEFFVQCTGDLPSVLHRLNVLLPSRKGKGTGMVKMRTWIDEIQATSALIEALGVQATKVTVDPFITPHDEYFDGILFEFHALDPSESSKSTMLAAGGRFDQLLRERWAAANISTQRDTSERECPCNGYGATINIERILSVEIVPSRQTFSPSQVLVCSKGTGSHSTKATTKLTDRAYSRIEKKAKILKILRDCGISAEIMPTSSPSMTQQFAYANSRSIPWLVIFDLDDVNGIVSLKHLKGKYEEDVSLSDLGYVIKNAMGHTSLSPGMK
eukprot:jgi/Picsp_1/1132/NSC_04613-R1_non-specific serine threonine protein kinase